MAQPQVLSTGWSPVETGSRKVVVETLGDYLLRPQVKADWATLMAFVLGAGPQVSAEFYFDGNGWKLLRIREGRGNLPTSRLRSIVSVLRAGGRRVEVASDSRRQANRQSQSTTRPRVVLGRGVPQDSESA